MNDRYGIIWGSEPRYATCEACGELAVCRDIKGVPLCAKHRDSLLAEAEAEKPKEDANG